MNAGVHRVVFQNLKIGDTFDSFDELDEFVKALQTRTNVQLYVRDCKSLESAKLRYNGRVRKAKPALKYYFIDYRCVFGGRRHKSRSTGARNTKTLRQECGCMIRLGLSKDCQKLIVTVVKDLHNHEVSESVYAHLPRQRRQAFDEEVTFRLGEHLLETDSNNMHRDASVVDGPSLVSRTALPELNRKQKYEQAMMLTTELARLMSDMDMEQFSRRLDMLNRLCDEWSAQTKAAATTTPRVPATTTPRVPATTTPRVPATTTPRVPATTTPRVPATSSTSSGTPRIVSITPRATSIIAQIISVTPSTTHGLFSK